MARPYGTGDRTPQERSASAWAVAAALVALIAGIWLVWAFWGDPDRHRTGDDVAGRPGARVGEIADAPATYAGTTVVIVGDVAGTLAPVAFVLEDDDPFSSDQILVVNATGRPITVTEDQEIRVTGDVRMFERAELERSLGYELDAELYVPWEGKPAVLASTIEKPGAASSPSPPGGASAPDR